MMQLRSGKKKLMSFEEISKRIDKHIEKFFPRTITTGYIRRIGGGVEEDKDTLAALTQSISLPVWDLLDRKGKRWRPVFAILLLESLGVEARPYEQLLSVLLELCHSGALIIDDIEDNSFLRRGKCCIHREYGLDVAVNAANTVYFLPFLAIEECRYLKEKQRARINRIMLRQLIKAHLGQAVDIFYSAGMSPQLFLRWLKHAPQKKILRSYAGKTGALVEGAAEIVGVISGVSKKTADTCVFFGRSFGMAFQIIDDIKDFDSSCRGDRRSGEDILSGRLTYVIVRALQCLSSSQSRRLRYLLSLPEKKRGLPAMLNEAMELVRTSGAFSICRKEAQDIWQAGWRRVTRVLPSLPAKDVLFRFCRELIETDIQVKAGDPPDR